MKIRRVELLACATAMVVLALPLSAAAQSRAARPERLVSLSWLQAHHDDPDVVILDVGMERAAFERGHIPGARFLSHEDTIAPDGHHLPAGTTLAEAFSRVGARNQARLVLYGDEPMVTGWVFMALASIGHQDHAVLLDGNLASWKAAGYAVATGPSKPAAGRLDVAPLPEQAIVEAAWVRDRLGAKDIALVDVRSDREWRQGMLPNASGLLWQDFFSDLAGGRFKTPQAIRQVFERAGVTVGKTAVTYCAVGMRAGLAYFAALAAGLPVRVYQGSWNDWTSRPDYPTVKK